MLKVTPLKAFEDNYIWIIRCSSTKQVIAVDPGDGQVVSNYLHEQQLQLTAILITHHHEDHTDGISQLSSLYSPCVYGPETSQIKGITHPVGSDDVIELPDSRIKVIAAPGHTQDHLIYLFESDTQHLFCGDTLFSAGCGRLFEGTAQQMFQTLTKINELPEQTLLYPAHEYTLSNLNFAMTVEPKNHQIRQFHDQCLIHRSASMPTLPVSLSGERLINPFLRTAIPEVAHSAADYAKQNLNSEEGVFTWLRRWKDNV